MDSNIFSIVPLEVLADKRLNSWHIRVLIGLLSFRNKNTDTVWPGRNKLAERCRMHVTNISKTTSELVELGWLIKEGLGGNSRSIHYLIIVPELEKFEEDVPQKLSTDVADLTTLEESKNPISIVADSATRTGPLVAESATLIVADSATRIEETIYQTNKNNRPLNAGARGLLEKFNLPDKIAETWLGIRTKKQLDLTEPDLEVILAESEKAHLTFEQAIHFCCDSGWAKFRAKWYFNELQKLKTGLQENTKPPKEHREKLLKRFRESTERNKLPKIHAPSHPTG